MPYIVICGGDAALISLGSIYLTVRKLTSLPQGLSRHVHFIWSISGAIQAELDIILMDIPLMN